MLTAKIATTPHGGVAFTYMPAWIVIRKGGLNWLAKNIKNGVSGRWA